MINAKVDDVIISDGSGTSIAEGKVIAITPGGDYVVTVTKETGEPGSPRWGDLYKIDQHWDFYSVKPQPKFFFRLGKTYAYSWSTDKYKILDIYKVQNPAWSGAEVAAVALVRDGSGKEWVDLLNPSDFSRMIEK